MQAAGYRGPSARINCASSKQQGKRYKANSSRGSLQVKNVNICYTSRTKQETALSPRGLAPGARVFATRGLRDRKALANPEGIKKF